MTRNKRILSARKTAFIRKNYQDSSDAKIAKAIDVDKKLVRRYLAENEFFKTPEQGRRIRESSNDPPEYRAELAIPSNRFLLSKKCILPALVVFFVAFIVYLITLAPTVCAEDGGELITAAYTLGIAHPPGYSLWCLLGKAFATLVPFGSVAYRVNLMSAFWGAAAAALLFLLAFKISGSIAASLGASLSFAFFADFWYQCVLAEVYTLNIFLITLVLLILVSYYHGRKLWHVWMLAFVSGLTLVHHNTATPIVFLSWMALPYISPKELVRPKPILVSALLVLVGLSIFLYLPIRSAANPPMDWGNPETFSAVMDHILRKQYAFSYMEKPREIGVLANQFGAFARLVSSQGTILFPLIAVAGGAIMWKRDRSIFMFLATVIAVCGPLLIFVINFELERESIETIRPFFLPVYLAMAALCAMSLEKVAGSFGRQKEKATVSVCVVLLALIPLTLNYSENDKSKYYYAYDYGMNLLKTVEQNGILFSSSDHSTFPAIYLQSVEGIRPDVVIADKYGYIEKSLYEDMPNELTSKFRKIPTAQERRMIEKWIVDNAERPIFFTKKRGMEDLPDFELVPWGLTYKLVKKTDPAKRPQPDLWSTYELRSLEGSDSHRDYSAHSIIGDYYFSRGREHIYHGEINEALRDLKLAARHAQGAKEVLNNLGSVFAENGLVGEAIRYYSQAVRIDPSYLLAHRNLSKLHEHLGDMEKSIHHQMKVCELQPKDHRTTLHLAGLFESAGDYDDAIKAYQKAIEMEPRDFRPFRSLGNLYLSLPDGRPHAIRMFAESLRRNPNQPDLEDILIKLRGNAPE